MVWSTIAFRSFVAAALLAVAVAGCTLIETFDGFGCDDGACRDASSVVDAAGDTGVDAARDTCAHTRWPSAPTVADDPTQITQITAVASLAAFGAVDAGPAPSGYDLDGVCTCPGPSSCVNAASDAGLCDEPGTGRDDAFRTVFSKLSSFGLGLDDTGLNAGLARGDYGIILRLDGYDGKSDDPVVSLAVYNAIGIEGAEAGAVPTYDGSDVWTLDIAGVRGGVGSIPNYVDEHAYVANGTLVASLDLVLGIIFYEGTTPVVLPIDVRAAHVTARVVAGANGYSLEDGQIAGRIPSASLFSLAAGLGYCAGSAELAAFEPLLCAALDVNEDPSHDAIGTAACDSLSSALSFRAVPAKTGAAIARPTRPSSCADASALSACAH